VLSYLTFSLSFPSRAGRVGVLAGARAGQLPQRSIALT
jgi:hypothetical protein